MSQFTLNPHNTPSNVPKSACQRRTSKPIQRLDSPADHSTHSATARRGHDSRRPLPKKQGLFSINHPHCPSTTPAVHTVLACSFLHSRVNRTRDGRATSGAFQALRQQATGCFSLLSAKISRKTQQGGRAHACVEYTKNI